MSLTRDSSGHEWQWWSIQFWFVMSQTHSFKTFLKSSEECTAWIISFTFWWYMHKKTLWEPGTPTGIHHVGSNHCWMQNRSRLGPDWWNCCYTKKVHETSTALPDDFVLLEVTTSKEKKVTDTFVIVKINKTVMTKLDTGTEVNVMPLWIYKQTETKLLQMRKTATKLRGYGGAKIPVIGMITVKCEFCDTEEQ